MGSRKSVLIPVVALSRELPGRLLEIVVERRPRVSAQAGRADFDALVGNGLGSAVVAATRALQGPTQLMWPNVGFPRMYLANPMPALSNSEGAALGVALGTLMHSGICRCERMLASGKLSEDAQVLTSSDSLRDKLATALALGPQTDTVPFLVPADARITAEVESLTEELAALNIAVKGVQTLSEAVAFCGALTAAPARSIAR